MCPNRVHARTKCVYAGPKRGTCENEYVGPQKGTRENKVYWAHKEYTRGQIMLGPKKVNVTNYVGLKKGTRENKVCWAQTGYR